MHLTKTHRPAIARFYAERKARLRTRSEKLISAVARLPQQIILPEPEKSAA